MKTTVAPLLASPLADRLPRLLTYQVNPQCHEALEYVLAVQVEPEVVLQAPKV